METPGEANPEYLPASIDLMQGPWSTGFDNGPKEIFLQSWPRKADFGFSNTDKATASMLDHCECCNGSGVARLHIYSGMFASCSFLRALAQFSVCSKKKTTLAISSHLSNIKTLTNFYLDLSNSQNQP